MTRSVSLHGFLGSPAAWDPVLGAGAHLGLQIPFHGIPAFHAECTSWERALELLEAQLPAGPLTLFGYSLGARLALGLTARLGARVTHAVLVSVHAGLDDAAERSARADFETTMATRLASMEMRSFVDEWERLPLFETQGQLDATTRAAQRRVRESHVPQVVAHAFRVLGTSQMPSYQEQLASIQTPLLFVTGARDAKYQRLAARYAILAPHAQHADLAGAGHNPLLEAPGALTQHVGNFLQQDSR